MSTAPCDMFADAHGYERFMGRWSRLAVPLLLDFARIPDRGAILDIGSGTGSLALAVEALHPGCQIVGVDRSREYVAFARSRTAKSRIQFETADAQSLPFHADTFDAVVSLLVLNFIPEPSKALDEARRVTRPGGYITAAVWDYGKGMRMLRVFWDAAVKLDPSAARLDEKHMPLCRKGELTELWTHGGLCDVEEMSLEIAMQFESYDDFWNPFLLGQGPAGAYIKRLASDACVALREELRRVLGDPSDAFVLPARLWAVRGSVAST
jgi:SAM-dependent methyltransferase